MKDCAVGFVSSTANRVPSVLSEFFRVLYMAGDKNRKSPRASRLALTLTLLSFPSFIFTSLYFVSPELGRMVSFTVGVFVMTPLLSLLTLFLYFLEVGRNRIILLLLLIVSALLVLAILFMGWCWSLLI